MASPSIVPNDRLDRDIYLVLEDFVARAGCAWRETASAGRLKPLGLLRLLGGSLGRPEQRRNSPNCHLLPARKSTRSSYLRPMRMAYELCLATAGKQVPDGPDWIHEVKHDGYRMLVIRENERARLLSRNGSDWTKRYPWIAEAALKNRQKRFVIDGEAVVLGVNGISDFNALHSRKT
ncbi:hypothetical protein ACVIIV_003301 [Bradyrhizobium sp. USDA 4354]